MLLAVGLSLGLPALALAVYAVAWSTGQMLTPIPLVLTPTLAVLDLLRRP